jgi:hypothetical protein
MTHLTANYPDVRTSYTTRDVVKLKVLRQPEINLERSCHRPYQVEQGKWQAPLPQTRSSKLLLPNSPFLIF